VVDLNQPPRTCNGYPCSGPHHSGDHFPAPDICQGKEIIPGLSSCKQALVKTYHAIRSAGHKPSTAGLRPQCPMLTMLLIALRTHAPSEQQSFDNSEKKECYNPPCSFLAPQHIMHYCAATVFGHSSTV
jgi:hypothetical protein